MSFANSSILFPKITLIVAMDNCNGIGKNNDLMWHLSDDLKRFKSITQGHTIVLGRKTWDSLPKKPLPFRNHIVISSKLNLDIENVTVVSNKEEALSCLDKEKENFIIGGAQIYKMFLTDAQKILLTRVFSNFEADVFFPELEPHNWEIIESSDIKIDIKNNIKFQFQTLIKKTHEN